jgi:hypothetical protein
MAGGLGDRPTADQGAGLHSIGIAWLEGEGDGGLSAQGLVSSGNPKTWCGFYAKGQTACRCVGRQHLAEQGEASHERGRSGNSMREEKQSMSKEGVATR